MSESNFIVPRGEMSIPKGIPQSVGVDVDPVSEGLHPAVLAHIIDLGTQENNFKTGTKSRQITLVFELPHEKREFSNEKGPQSSMLWKTMSFVVSEQSNLYKVLKAITGKNEEPEYFANFNLGELLGKPLTLNVSHKRNNKGQVKAGIESYAKFNPNLVPEEQFVPEVPNQFFLIDPSVEDMNFATYNFATLYEKVREQILRSDEAKAYAERGGQFAQHIETSPTKSTPKPPSSESNLPENLIWLSKEFTYDDMVKQGWTKDDLVGHGYAKIKEVVPEPPKAPSAPSSSVPTPPSAPKAPSAPQPPKTPQPPTNNSGNDSNGQVVDDLPF